MSEHGQMNILVVYQHLPHYRFGVFSELQSIPDMTIHFAAGMSSADPGIQRIEPSLLKNVHSLKNIWLGPLLWQRRLLPLLMRDWNAVIFLGDAAYVSTWLGAALLRVRRRPVIFWTIGWHRPDSGLRRLIRLAFYRLANHLMLYGNVARDIGTSMGYPRDRMTVIYNSISWSNEDAETSLPTIRPPQSEIPLIGAVTRLTPAKRLDLLLRATSRLGDRTPGIGIRILGEGPDRDHLMEIAHQLNVDLELPGECHDPLQIAQFYDDLWLTVVPSAAGLTVIQSLKYGRPVVTHNNPHTQAPECEAIKEDATGSLYREGDVEDLAAHIEKWIRWQRQRPREIAGNCRDAWAASWTASSQALAIRGVILRSATPISSKG